MNIANLFKLITYSLVLLGALNWGLVGIFNFNLVSFLFGDMTYMSRIIYTLIGLCAITYFALSIKDETHPDYNC